MSGDASVDIAALLTELGFDSPEAQALARQALYEAKLSREGKARIDGQKRGRVEALLSSKFLVTCGSEECARTLGDRQLVRAEQATRCAVCHGSANKRAVTEAAKLFAKHGIRRLVVVGGSPGVHGELERLRPAGWELRIIDGTERRTLDLARADIRWADLILIWGSSELDHKVSEHYTREAPKDRLVTATRRGIAGLLEAAVTHLSRRR